MTRRGWRAFALLTALVLVLAACGGGGDGGTSTSPSTEQLGEPVDGGTLRFGIEAETDGLNPTTNAFAIAALQMGNAVFDPLAIYDPEGNVYPYLAESFTPNDDFTAWDIKLRPGIKFHDGTPLTSEAIKVNTEAALADPLVSLAIKPTLDEEKGVEIVDDLTARIFLDAPTANLPSFLTGQIGMIGSPKWIEAAKDDPELNQKPVGTGPYMFESRDQGNRTVFVKNPDWWGTDTFGGPHFDKIEFVVQSDPILRSQGLEGGDLDILHTTDAQSIQRLTDGGYGVVSDSTQEDSFVMMNTENAPFDDIRVRKALTLATPKQQYLDLIGLGILDSADSMFPEGSKYYNPDVVQEADQPDEAVALAQEYCAEHADLCNGDKIKMSYKYTGPDEQNQRVTDVLVEGWSAAFDVNAEQVRQDDYIQQVALGQYQVVTWRQFGAPDPDADIVWIDCRTVGLISLNWPRNCNEDTQRLIEEQRASTDEATRIADWKQIAQNLHDDYLYVFLVHTDWSLFHTDQVKNIDGATIDGTNPAMPLLNGRVFVNQAWLTQ